MEVRRRPLLNGSDPIEVTETTGRDSTPRLSSRPRQILKYSSMFIVPYLYLVCFHSKIDARLKLSILINAVFSAAGFAATMNLIPVISRKLLSRGICGFDINKKGTPQGSTKVPEALGIAVGAVLWVLIVFFWYLDYVSNSKWDNKYVTALVSITPMMILGLADDFYDLRWRVKLLMSSIAAFALLWAYTGPTSVIIPNPLKRYPLTPYIGDDGKLELGWVYKLYLWLLAIFCTNSINIHAGINGLEVGQTVVISGAILIHNVMQIGAASDHKEAHTFSISLVQPLLATSLALLSFNWYPSSVFVGDTYTYLAGMTMAVAGILGHFSETLLIFFLPQVLNFLLSLPQLSGYVPCPRHRLPRFDLQTGLLTGTNDGNLVNFFLRRFGKMSERSLCVALLAFQVICCGFCFFLRWLLAGWWK